jgi:hypothetical protein
MNTLIIACQMISDELNLAISQVDVDHPVIWIESRFHEQPDRLRAKLQDEINRISNVQHIVLAFGYCGNALLGLEAKGASLIIPRVDDCISLLLGSQTLYHKLSSELGTYFLTKGWLEYENGMLHEFERNIDRYGQNRAQEISRAMLAHYSRLILIDTGAYKIDVCLEKVQRLAGVLGIDYKVMPGSGDLLNRLLQGPWDSFSIVPPGGTVTEEHLWGQRVYSVKCGGKPKACLCSL